MTRTIRFDGPRAVAAATAFAATAKMFRLPWTVVTAGDADKVVTLTAADDTPAVVNQVVAELLGGGQAAPPPPPPAEAKKTPAAVVRVGRETAGRKGKGVTVVRDVPLGEAGLRDLAAKLKEKCGTGGTVKDGVIEIQGDHRDRLMEVLEQMGYRPKRAGG